MQVSKFKFLYFLTFVFIFQTNIFAAGIIDQTFGSNGTLNLNFGNQTNAVDADVKTDGKIVVAGTVANVTSGKDIFVAQYNPNGTLDTTFGSNGVTVTSTNLDESINDLEIQADGKIIVVGQQQAVEGVAGIFDFLVVRYNSNGQLDNTFGNGGIVTVNQNQQDILTKVAVQADGKIVAVGITTEINRLRVIFRFNVTGTIDTTFASNGFWYETIASSPVLETGFLDIEALSNDRFIVVYSSYFRLNEDDAENKLFLVTFNSNGIANSLTQRVVRSFGIPRIQQSDLERLPNAKFVVASNIGVRFFNPTDNSITTGVAPASFISNPFVAVFNDGKYVVSNDNFGSLTTQLFSPDSIIGFATNLPAGKIVAQADGKFVVLANNSITRIKNLTSQATRIGFNNGLGKTNLVVDRLTTNTVFILRSPDTYNTFSPLFNSNRKIIPETGALGGYYYRAGNTFYQQFGQNITLGTANDSPVSGDFDGDGFADFAVFTTSGDWIFQSGRGVSTTGFYHWGTTGDKPVPADYDYDGITDYAIFRPSTGVWWIHRSSNDSYFTVPFGLSSDIPLTGDYDADGKADFVVYRPSTGTWYLQMTTEGFKAVNFGLPTDIPVPGDYDGDGKHDIAVFRNGIWYLLQSRDGFAGIQWGTTGDIPVTVRYDN
jgi:uncharacterized delta-60 repeat protein